MKMLVDVDFDMLHRNSWDSAVYNLNTIKHYYMEELFMEHLEEVFSDIDPTDMQVNDYLCHVFNAENFVAENTAFNTLTDIDELEGYTITLHFREAQSTITEARQQDKENRLWKYLKYGFDMRNVLEVMEELDEFDVTNF